MSPLETADHLTTLVRCVSAEPTARWVQLMRKIANPDPPWENVIRAVQDFPEANWSDAASHGQLRSKAWAVEELARLQPRLGRVFLMAGWYGTLAFLLLADTDLTIDQIVSFDIDPACQPVADALNRRHVIDNWRFKAATADIFDIRQGRYDGPVIRANGSVTRLDITADTIINTSCDHIAPFDRWWSEVPAGKLVLLQNNDFAEAGEDHVNTVSSLDEMIAQAPMSRILYEGEMVFPKYRRFMLIGVR